jgi:hypothetical protein
MIICITWWAQLVLTLYLKDDVNKSDPPDKPAGRF